MSSHPPKELRAAIEAARKVLGAELIVEKQGGSRHPWRLIYRQVTYPLCCTPQNHEDQRRYARQWAQRQLRRTTP